MSWDGVSRQSFSTCADTPHFTHPRLFHFDRNFPPRQRTRLHFWIRLQFSWLNPGVGASANWMTASYILYVRKSFKTVFHLSSSPNDYFNKLKLENYITEVVLIPSNIFLTFLQLISQCWPPVIGSRKLAVAADPRSRYLALVIFLTILRRHSLVFQIADTAVDIFMLCVPSLSLFTSWGFWGDTPPPLGISSDLSHYLPPCRPEGG